MRRPVLCLTILALLSARGAAAQTPPASGVAGQVAVAASNNVDVPRVMHAHRTEATIHIDGKLDEAVWSSVAAEGDFVTQWPKDRAPASQKTEARVLYDGDAIYVGVRLFDTRPDSIAAQLARRDVTGIYSDWLHVVIDSYHDRRTGFRFSVNPKGVQKDVRHFDDRSEDVNWDAVWQVSTSIDSLGWVAEYRIPLSQLRYGEADANGARKWGIQFSRDIARYQERDNWSPIAQTANGFVSRFGDIDGLNNLSAPRRLEAVPYVSGRLTRAPGIEANPFYKKNATTPNVGGDVRLGVGSGLTLTATVNPDFGQVELDPAIVNLSAFEQSFPERRPFFVEGADIFNFGRLNSNNGYGGLQLLYSRRLGRSPQRGAFGADSFGRRPTYADAPTETSILGAAKLSGKTAGGWSIGILDGVTNREEARLLQTITPTGAATPFDIRRSTPVEPMTNYFIGRTRRDFRQGRTVIGAILTHTARDLSARDRPFDLASSSLVEGPEVFRPMLVGSAGVGGVDFEHSWANRVYSVSAYAVGSRIGGSSTTISNAQRAPYRLFQRPDGSRSVDTSLTALSGGAYGAAILRRGRHWGGSIAYQDYSPGLEINDVGFGQTADRRAFSTEIEYNELAPRGRLKSFRQYGSYLFTTSAVNYDGNNVYQQIGGGAYGQRAKSLWNFNVSGGFQPGVFNDRLLRGGPLAKSPDSWYGNVNITTDPRKLYVLSTSANGNQDGLGGYNGSFSTSVDTRPRTYLRVTVGPSISHGQNMTQYVARVTDAEATATYGSRYLFAKVEQTTFALSTRINWTFTPRMTLEVVAQPFVSSGAYSDFKYFSTPRARDYVRFGVDAGTLVRDSAKIVVDADGAGPSKAVTLTNPDFTLRSMRGSAVMRWEYRPGSTLFFVWQQNRSGSSAEGTLAPRDFSKAFSEPGQNVFLVKASFWLSR